jgi:hypothetical protein
VAIPREKEAPQSCLPRSSRPGHDGHARPAQWNRGRRLERKPGPQAAMNPMMN